ncbi:MAG: hypothetical protein CMN87_14105 [Stappia sp.]|uniref:hypothetical protein n=1 Tax=Stappia sp. TaxID=1870903 RepID=UPI000C6B6F0C|nr:hypothetical protein [Stappia sp.]MAA96829.1 hypothetical protein [Stappia sp.]MBM21137.1 hypothetical protein [Stappia sp.]
MSHASRTARLPVESLRPGHEAPVAGRGPAEAASVQEAGRTHRITLVELRVLAAGAGLAAPGAARGAAGRTLLDESERQTRLEQLVLLWQGGCRRLVDETLYLDIAARHPDLARRVRRRLRRSRAG